MLTIRKDLARVKQVGKDCLVVFRWALIFKLAMLGLQVIANNLIPDHQGSMDDVSMRVHRHPNHDIITEALLGGFDNWDAEYYIYIAQNGYTFLQSMAFFPLYPMLMWLVARVALFPLNLLLEERSVFLIAGTLVNLCVFPLAAVALYLLTLFVSQNQRFSILTIILFCVNPASVFMSAVYTETLFAFCTFTGLYLLAYHYSWSATLFFSLASATRSNGIVLAAFIAYFHLYRLYSTLYSVSKTSVPQIAKAIIICTLQCIVIVLPFLLFQAYSYWIFCRLPTTPGESGTYEWCHWMLPLSYSYIQQHYWNVGFLRYFELKQIPNFLLAFPAVCLSCYTLYSFTCGHKQHQVLKNFSLMPACVVHLLFLLGFGVLNMHVQVLTRFLFSSSPLLYWASARVLSSALSQSPYLPPSSYTLTHLFRTLAMQLSFDNGRSLLIVLYFLVYVSVGFFLHCNFYPWT